MKVPNLKHVTFPAIVLGARLQTIVLPFIAFYLLLFIFFNWLIAIVGFVGGYAYCIYLTQKDIFLIETLQATLKVKSIKVRPRSKLYVA